jgi:uncharacterized membrane protein YdjX (TVP38/TMEM64 family)
MPTTAEPRANVRLRFGLATRLALLAIVGIAFGLALYRFRDSFQIEALATRESEFRSYYADHPVRTLTIAFILYVAVTGLSLPGAAAMSVAYGWLFGFGTALVLVSFASTSGATIAMLLSRYLLGDYVQARYGERLQALNVAVQRDGALYLLSLRLIPQVPFFLVNIAAGLTRLPVRTFWWVSQLGMLPGTIAFVLAGAWAPTLKQIAERGARSLLDWRLAAVLALLGIMPLVLRWALRRTRTSANHP